MAVIVLHCVAAAFDDCRAIAYCCIEMRVFEGFGNASYGNSGCFTVCSVKPFAGRLAGWWFVARMMHDTVLPFRNKIAYYLKYPLPIVFIAKCHSVLLSLVSCLGKIYPKQFSHPL